MSLKYWDGTEWVRLLTEAPSDGSQYARQDETWVVVTGGGGGGSLPNGGTTGQVLTKQSATDGDADWETIVLDGGGA